MLLETLQVELTSQKWRQIFVIVLCVACAFTARIFIHWSCAEVTKAMQPPAAESAPSAQESAPSAQESAPSAQVEPGAPGRRF